MLIEPPKLFSIAIIGAGPAGLMAAEVLLNKNVRIDVYDSMPSVGRKFLMAGKGGMNITHAEPFADFLSRYGAHRNNLEPLLKAFTPSELRDWIHTLGIQTFVGTSGRVFPSDMKAAPLLRAWLHRLREGGVNFHVRHRWRGWNDDGSLYFQSAQEEYSANSDAVILALGGGSWPQLGSDAQWIPLLQQRGIEIAPLQPSNCGFNIAWSDHFKKRFVGEPIKSVSATFNGIRKKGELVITEYGVEGGLIYALSTALRDEIKSKGSATFFLDLLPDWDEQRVRGEVFHPRGSRSVSSHLQSRLKLRGAKTNLLREVLGVEGFANPTLLAASIKALPLTLTSSRPLSEAISSAGGIKFEAMNEHLMLRKLPGVFCAGEMLDWEAPTGGYLLSACFASGKAAGEGALSWQFNCT
ncbi:MAG: TIGR03862 family flavoprotein [Gallionellaceae bacterium]|nr:TIGR03862 family flavoprotein [Gallionellaceae bacterium]